MKYLDLDTKEGQIVAALAGIGAMAVGSGAVPERASIELPAAVAGFLSHYSPEDVTRVLDEVVGEAIKRQLVFLRPRRN